MTHLLWFFLAFTAHASEFEIEGLSVGKTPCSNGVQQLYKTARANCEKVKIKDEEKERIIKEWKASHKIEEDKVSWDEYCKELTKNAQEEALLSWRRFLESGGKDDASCAVGYVLDPDFKTAFEFQTAGILDPKKYGGAKCPLHAVFWTGNVSKDSFTQASVACYKNQNSDAAAHYYAKYLSGEYIRIKYALTRKWGAPVKTWAQLSRLARQGHAETHQVNALFIIKDAKAGRNFRLLLVNNATAKTPSLSEAILSGKLLKVPPIELSKLEYSDSSTLYYFSNELSSMLEKDAVEAKKIQSTMK